MPPNAPTADEQMTDPGLAAFSLPVNLCIECGYRDLAAFIGNFSGDITHLSPRTFADERGYIHCPQCGAVWDSIRYADEPETVAIPDAPWLEGPKPKHSTKAEIRLRERIWDAEALGSYLSLPEATMESVRFHLEYFYNNIERTNPNGLPRYGVRQHKAETITMAIIKLVMENQDIERNNAAWHMRDAIRFKDKPPISSAEFRAAYHACATWFSKHLWRGQR